jgi:tetratricopeptide (TPR) repeat protein
MPTLPQSRAAHRPDLARSLTNLGVRYSELGRPADALPCAQEAVAIYRELASSDPDTHRRGLANSLQDLDVWYSELGREPEAELATAEAEALREKS